eukprot:297393-Pelagomonas_calceolata.AAC.6
MKPSSVDSSLTGTPEHLLIRGPWISSAEGLLKWCLFTPTCCYGLISAEFLQPSRHVSTPSFALLNNM